MPGDALSEPIFPGARERYQRFVRHFRLNGDVGDAVNRVLDEEGEKSHERDGADRPLSVLIGTVLGKAMKTFQAIERLCLLGYGEDAAVLLRTNVNLLVNVAYIVSDEYPNERAAEFIADGWCRYRTFLREAYGKEVDATVFHFHLSNSKNS